MKVAYLDCFSGISGNMVLGALLDAGLELEQLNVELARLGLTGYRLVAQSVHRRGIAGTHVEVEIEEEGVARHLHHIEEIIQNSALPDEVKMKSLAIFRRLAEAEAKVHGEPVEHIHFHEVGAMDAIVDVVGSAIGFWLLGVERVYASHVHVGRGTVECAHGTIPVPAPATLELLRGVPTYGRDVEAELVTPTGAAILSSLAESFGSAPPMRVERVGYGAGTRDLPLPNLLRLSIGETTAAGSAAGYEQDLVTLIETNIDDMNPQLYEHVMERLFAAGALDVYLTPIQMKRNRPGIKLSVLVDGERVPDMIDILFAETTAIGVRTCPMHRQKLARERVVVGTLYGEIGVKVARKGENVVNITPEYRECKLASEEHDVPLKDVCRVVLEAAWDHQLDQGAT